MNIDSTNPQLRMASVQILRDSMRNRGAIAGRVSFADLEGCFNPAAAFEGWRAHCLVELAEEHGGHPDFAGLTTAWEMGFDSVQPLGLTPKEMELLKAYRLADERGRQSIVEKAVSQAEDWPRYTFSSPCQTEGAAS